jgi:hypothetical protein
MRRRGLLTGHRWEVVRSAERREEDQLVEQFRREDEARAAVITRLSLAPSAAHPAPTLSRSTAEALDRDLEATRAALREQGRRT